LTRRRQTIGWHKTAFEEICDTTNDRTAKIPYATWSYVSV